MKESKSKIILIFLALSIMALAGRKQEEKIIKPGQKESSTMEKSEAKENSTAAKSSDEVKTPLNKTLNGYSLDFDVNSYTEKTAEVDGKTIKYRAYENIVYVKNPVDINYQTMNIYIPEEYFNGKRIGRYSERTAPVFFPNTVGGYMPGAAEVAGINKRSGKNNAALVALSKGYVVAAPGARGRTLKNSEGKYTGKAPAAIVDLKAAVRYLHFNDKVMPGDANKIISNGTSAGGALSALLGASGNSGDYEKYLKELGAAEGKDDRFAVSAYCPITNLEHANEAYEWMFNGIDTYHKMTITMLDYNVERKTEVKELTEAEKVLSPQLKAIFPAYVNSLNLKDSSGKLLTLDKKGEGSFKEHVKKYIIESGNKELSKGTDLSQFKFLTIKNNVITDVNFEEYAKNIGRLKAPGAFDAMDLSTGENNLFGDADTDNKHFTEFMMNYNEAEKSEMAEKEVVKMMNPMNYIGNKSASTAKYWRIRHGEADRDTSLAIPVILALKLENSGKDVDFSAPWAQGHGGDYDLDELFEWMEKVSN